MTTNTKKILVAILLCVILCATIVLGVLSFIPEFYVSDSEIFFTAISRIKKSNSFADTRTATYTVELDEGVSASSVKAAIKTRLEKAYGYYGAEISYNCDTNELTIKLPKNLQITASDEPSSTSRDANAKAILESVTANGKLEILNSSSAYSADSVVLTQEHFKRARVRTYVQNKDTFYICEIRLTSAGTSLADSKLTIGTQYAYAIDETTEHAAYYTKSGTLQLYAHDTEEANRLAGYVKSGVLGATLTLDDKPVDVANKAGWVYLLVFFLLVVASFAFFAVRYKGLSAVPITMQLLAVVIYIIFAAFAYSEIFNVAAAVGTILAYAFMTFFTVFTFDKIFASMKENKSYSWSRHMAFKSTDIISLIAHGALLVLGIILWVIPTLVTAPLGCALVYGAVLSFAVTFGLNRLFAFLASPYFENTGKKARK